jgi:hypothetical protein
VIVESCWTSINATLDLALPAWHAANRRHHGPGFRQRRSSLYDDPIPSGGVLVNKRSLTNIVDMRRPSCNGKVSERFVSCMMRMAYLSPIVLERLVPAAAHARARSRTSSLRPSVRGVTLGISGKILIPILTLSNPWLPSRGVRWT